MLTVVGAGDNISCADDGRESTDAPLVCNVGGAYKRKVDRPQKVLTLLNERASKGGRRRLIRVVPTWGHPMGVATTQHLSNTRGYGAILG